MTSRAPELQAAYESHDWDRTLELLEGIGDPSDLTPDELLLRADALYWTARFDEAVDSFESAHTELVEEDRLAEAGWVAALLAYFAVRRQAFAVAGGWLARAEKLLDGAPESLGHAWLRLLHVGMALFNEGKVAEAIELSDDAIELAARVDSPSSESLAMSFKGLALVSAGNWREGLQLMDESMIIALASADDLRMTSDVYCNTIAACRNLGDYRRAEEWTDEAERWMRSNLVNGYTGACQVHRAELKLIHGSWTAAEEEARRACIELERFQLVDYLGTARYGIGEVRRRMGDLEGAQEAFEQAYADGHDAQPGLSLLMLDRGDVEEALASITKAAIRREAESEPEAWRGPSRARLLPALVEIAVAGGDLGLAASASEELEEIARAFESAVWEASSDACRGSVALARGEIDSAVDLLESAVSMLQRQDLPYEMARTRALLGEARRRAGDETGARLDLKAARDVLRDLGAARDVGHITALLGEDDDGLSTETRVTRTFMFTDIVKSTDLIGVIGDHSWRELLAWHNRTLRSAIEDVGGELVRHTGDGFFASFANAREAIDSAVDIQRRLRDHRRNTGFAPFVRIGLHQAEAIREQNDYSGGGVHAAARIGASAEAEQIVLSAETLDAGGPVPYPVGEKWTATLKGISAPVDVYDLDWR